MNVVTYNLRFVYTKDGINSFIHRAGLILDTIRKEQPDIICFQEATDTIADFLRSCLSPAYTILLTQREEGLTGEGLAVAYRPEAVTLYGLEVFWLSPTPQVVASKFPGQSKHSRICQNLLFKDERSGRQFRLYNLHLEEVSEDVRVKQMELVLERQAKEEVPTILLGDFNSRSDGQVAPLCKSKGLADVTAHITHSFHGFGKWEQGIKLDYIFADPETAQTISNVHIWDACLNGIYLSDHYPIAMELQF